MTDIALAFNADFMEWDIALSGGDLAQDAGLETAAVLSLFLDRWAHADDALPAGSTRRGWWGDRVAPLARPQTGTGSAPDRIGSRLWLLARERQLPAVLPLAKGMIAEALAWMVEDGWAASLDVAVSFPRRGWLLWTVAAHKPDGTTVLLTQSMPWGL